MQKERENHKPRLFLVLRKSESLKTTVKYHWNTTKAAWLILIWNLEVISTVFYFPLVALKQHKNILKEKKSRSLFITTWLVTQKSAYIYLNWLPSHLLSAPLSSKWVK